MRPVFAALFLVGIAVGLPGQTNTNIAPTPPATATNAVATPDAPTGDSGALLLDACLRSDVNQAANLLDHGAPVDARGKGGTTPLILAATRNPEMVRLLLAHHPNLELQEAQGYTALGAACWTGRTDCGIELLDAGANVEALNRNGHTPLILAIEFGDDDLVKALIERHADVNWDTVHGSAIWWALEKDRLRDAVMLIDAGADFHHHTTVLPDPRNPWYTVVASAAMSNDPLMVNLVLAHGGDINEADALGRTPLVMAIKYARPFIIQCLLDKGADARQADHEGTTPLMYAVGYQDQPVWQALLQHGALVLPQDSHGTSALMRACRDDNPFATAWLLDHGADVNAVDGDGNSALAWAGDRGSIQLVQLLSGKGAKPVPLHIIAKKIPSPPLPMAQRWALAVGALYTQWNGSNPNVLGGDVSAAQAKRLLLSEWRIRDHDTLVACVNQLRMDGSRGRYNTEGAALARVPGYLFSIMTFWNSDIDQKNRAIRQNYLTWKNRIGMAADLCRAANLVNAGYACHYIDEYEAWNLLMPIAREVQVDFVSWHEMCDNFLDGREMWRGKADPDLDACGDLLCNPKDPNSPWNQIPWNTDLSTP